MTVLLAGPASAPRVLDRRRIELSEPAIPDSMQPYHAGFGTEQQDSAVIARLTSVITKCANKSLASLIKMYDELGPLPTRMGIVVGSTADPASIANQHIRAHAQEGTLFRSVVETAAAGHGIRSVIVRERDLYAVAAKTLGLAPDVVRRRATDLGRAVDGPWRAEEKAATVGAWLVLASSAVRVAPNERRER